MAAGVLVIAPGVEGWGLLLSIAVIVAQTAAAAAVSLPLDSERGLLVVQRSRSLH